MGIAVYHATDAYTSLVAIIYCRNGKRCKSLHEWWSLLYYSELQDLLPPDKWVLIEGKLLFKQWLEYSLLPSEAVLLVQLWWIFAIVCTSSVLFKIRNAQVEFVHCLPVYVFIFFRNSAPTILAWFIVLVTKFSFFETK